MEQWIDTYVSAELADHAKDYATRTVNNYRTGQVGPNMTESEAYMTGFIEGMASDLFDQAGQRANELRSWIIIPWDVRNAIATDQSWNQMFPGDDRSLPVQVTINGLTFEHSLTDEFVYGLLDFYQAANQQPPILSLYGEKFDRIYNLDGQEQLDDRYSSEHYDEGDLPYMVRVGGQSKSFDHLEYLQGMKTAAQWLNMDVHALVRNLEGFAMETGEYEPLTF